MQSDEEIWPDQPKGKDNDNDKYNHLGASASQLLPTVFCIEDHLSDLVGQPKERAPEEKTSGMQSHPNGCVLRGSPVYSGDDLSDGEGTIQYGTERMPRRKWDHLQSGWYENTAFVLFFVAFSTSVIISSLVIAKNLQIGPCWIFPEQIRLLSTHISSAIYLSHQSFFGYIVSSKCVQKWQRELSLVLSCILAQMFCRTATCFLKHILVKAFKLKATCIEWVTSSSLSCNIWYDPDIEEG